MKTKILFVERKASSAVSIEKVFQQVAKSLPSENFVSSFRQLKYPNGALGTLKNLLSFKKPAADIYHITGHVHYMGLLLPKKNTVLTIHDVGILHLRSGLKRFILKKLLLDLPVGRLKYITAVSEATKREIVFYTNCDERKIRVIENPLQEHFNATEKKIFDGQEPLILQIGTTANKNIANLIKAVAGIKCRLNIIGELDAATVNLLKESRINYQNKTNLNDIEMRKEYEKADMVTFCSTFEGFGLPIIEAQAMLTPVITSNLSPMKEVAGSGATLVDPHDSKQIKDGILHIINDEEYRENTVKKGIENIKKYRPENVAFKYESLYNELLNQANKT